ncbi:acyltransferase family protein [Aeromonas dhakensis]|uniref:acyltransferase family protein n=1 Tax=Aeromonas dhakensis TaxID=196024 RepID=UPI003BA1762A
MLNNFSKANRWLDICRASAILLVLLSHGRRLLFPIFPDAQFLKFGGFLGVEIFFVLSGFLIGSILIDKSTSR